MKYILSFLIGSFLLILTAYQPRQATAGQKDDYELQERCSKRAAERFKEDSGYFAQSDKDTKYRTTYINHYNRKLNKCFVLFATFGVPMGKKDIQEFGTSSDKSLWDINENKQYGDFFKFRASPDPIICEVSDKLCHSEAEWDSLVKTYMEE
jgi:hypothetical protein